MSLCLQGSEVCDVIDPEKMTDGLNDQSANGGAGLDSSAKILNEKPTFLVRAQSARLTFVAKHMVQITRPRIMVRKEDHVQVIGTSDAWTLGKSFSSIRGIRIYRSSRAPSW